MKKIFSNYSLIAWAAGMLGLVSTFSQLFLVREFLSVFYGNELVIGILLFSWIFLSGLGSYLAIWFERSRSLIQWIGAGFMALALAPMLSYVLLAWLYPLFLDQGELAGLADITVLALLALLPVCLLNGILFSLFSQVFQKTDSISKNYSFESIGGLIGGVVIYFWSGNRFEATDALLILGSLILVYGLVFAWLFGHLKRLIFGYLGAFAVLLALAQTQSGVLLQKNSYGSQLVVFQENTNSGKLTVTQLSDQLNVFVNGFLWYSTGECPSCEEAVHFVLAQRTEISNVMLIGGGITTVPLEILKYKPQKLVYTEVVPELVDFSKNQNMVLSNPAVFCQKGDIYNLLKNEKEKYNAILVNIPEPYSAAVNRYYTTSFFDEASRHLTSDGIISVSLPSFNTYCTSEALQLHSTVFSTLKSIFPHVEIISGQRNYFLASNSPVSPEVVRLSREKKFETTFVNSNYLNDSILTANSADLKKRMLMHDSEVNTVLKPSSNLGQLNFWMSHFGKTNRILIGIGLAFLFYFIFRLSRVGKSVFIAGFSCLALEMVIMVVYQALCGTIYRGSGIIISIFMAGMALGFWIKLPESSKLSRWISNVLFILAVLCLLPVGLVFYPDLFLGSNYTVAFVLLAIGFIFSLFTGLLFALGVAMGRGNIGQIVAETYGADMLGASLGALLVSSVLIPAIGVSGVGVLLSFILLISAVIFKFSK